MVNDKIYQLARQAELIEFESIPGSTAVTPSYESIAKARKFAELIVAECIQVCSNVEADTEMDLSDGALVCMAEIKEHFGVEE
jgi:hypothetical protein